MNRQHSDRRLDPCRSQLLGILDRHVLHAPVGVVDENPIAHIEAVDLAEAV